MWVHCCRLGWCHWWHATSQAVCHEFYTSEYVLVWENHGESILICYDLYQWVYLLYHSLLVFIGRSCRFCSVTFFNFEMFHHPCVSVVAAKAVETGDHGDHGDSPWVVEGPCETVGSCVQSPNYPKQYPNRQSCSLSLPKPSVVTILDFLTPAVN